MKPRLTPLFTLVVSLVLALSARAQTTPEPAVTLDTVRVTASPASADEMRREASASKLIVSREELEKFDVASLAELLRRLPGVSLAGDSDIGRRGRPQAADRLEPRIVVDGEALPGGNRAALRLPVELIERIEIIKNSTAEFPAGPGGTVNLILRDAPPKKAGSFRLGASYYGDAIGARAGGVHGDREGANGVLWTGFASSQPLAGERTVAREHFSAGVRDDWDIETDTESGRDNRLHLSPRFTRDLGKGERLIVSPFLSYSDTTRRTATALTTYALPATGDGLMNNGREQVRDSGERLNGRLAAELKRRQPGMGETSARLALQGENEARSNRNQTYDPAGALVGDTRTEETRRGWDIAFTGKRSLPLADVHLATFGMEARHRTRTDSRDQTVNGLPVALAALARVESREQALAVWGQDEWQLAERHLLTPGLRLQTLHSRSTDALGAAQDRTHTAWMPTLHYLWQVNPRWNLRSSLALDAKAPALNDLSPVVRTADGVNSVSNPDRAGNPTLDAERTATLQLGAEHFLPAQRGSAGLNLYARQIEDKVQRRILLEAGRFVERPVNAGAANETSLVADFKWRLADLPGLTLRGNASTSRLRLEDPATARQENPRHSASLGFDYDHAAHKFTLGGNLSFSSRFTRETSVAIVQTQRATRQLDLYASKRLDRRLNLRASIDNVTRAGRGNDSVEYAGDSVSRIEQDRARGVRSFNLGLEGKW